MAAISHLEKTKGSRNLNNISFLANLRSRNPLMRLFLEPDVSLTMKSTLLVIKMYVVYRLM